MNIASFTEVAGRVSVASSRYVRIMHVILKWKRTTLYCCIGNQEKVAVKNQCLQEIRRKSRFTRSFLQAKFFNKCVKKLVKLIRHRKAEKLIKKAACVVGNGTTIRV